MGKKISSDEQKFNMEVAFKGFMEAMGLDLEDPSLKETPKRIAKMFHEQICRGLKDEVPNLKAFPNDGKYNGMVVVRNMKVESLCEHHFMPFLGKCDIAYIPGKTIIGLSKFPRLVDHYARRPQVQERLTQQIFDHLKEVLDTENIIIRINAEHLCVKVRGVQDPCSDTVTCLAGGVFGITGNGMARQEFFDHLKI